MNTRRHAMDWWNGLIEKQKICNMYHEDRDVSSLTGSEIEKMWEQAIDPIRVAVIKRINILQTLQENARGAMATQQILADNDRMYKTALEMKIREQSIFELNYILNRN